MNGIKNKDIQVIEVTEEEKFIQNFKSMFYRMNAKPDSMTKIFTKEVIIGIEDIKQLNSIITNKLKNHYYKDAGFIISVTISFKNRTTISFSNWTDFEKHEWIESNAINSVTITWDFNITLPNYQNPQRHTLTVKLSNGMRPEEMLNIIFSGNIEDLDEANMNRDFFPVVARVDFIDPEVGEELLNKVLKWCEGLQLAEVSQNNFILKLQKHKRKVSYLVNYIIIFILFILGMIFFDYTINKFDIDTIAELGKKDLITLVNSMCIYLGGFVFLNNWFGKIANNLFGQLQDYGDNHLFNITKGDLKKQQNIIHKNKRKLMGIYSKLIFTIIMNIVCSLLASYLYSKLNGV
ncbi:hypothetical protein AB2T96_21000 [Clostridium butyricum]|uniref:hypothetical protein n=2 Tax=Clostridium butyricum TaxID=1492 RepID=UPI0034669C84